MKHLYQILAAHFIVILLASVTVSQQPTPTIELPLRGYLKAPLGTAFPTDMFCPDMENFSEGPTWGELTVGASNVEDFKAYVGSIGNFDSINQWADYISLSRTGGLNDDSGIPSGVRACLDPTTQTITALNVSKFETPLFLEDLVAAYGIPDAVTWASSPLDRTVFWFDKGIAASINIYVDNPMSGYGQVGFVIYFPYQSTEDFEERWPYNRTNAENPTGGDVVYLPAPSELQNPFDFEAMIATITAQPSRTPTSTFVPFINPKTSIATPIP